MQSNFDRFERIVRQAYQFTEASTPTEGSDHPFETHNIHPDLPGDVRRLFDNGHYPQASFEAFKFLDLEVQRVAASTDYGKSLMMKAFNEVNPVLSINPGMTPSEKSEQEGYKLLFAGAILAIRNPRGHLTSVNDDIDTCLHHLNLASMLLRRLEEAGLR